METITLPGLGFRFEGLGFRLPNVRETHIMYTRDIR